MVTHIHLCGTGISRLPRRLRHLRRPADPGSLSGKGPYSRCRQMVRLVVLMSVLGELGITLWGLEMPRRLQGVSGLPTTTHAEQNDGKPLQSAFMLTGILGRLLISQE